MGNLARRRIANKDNGEQSSYKMKRIGRRPVAVFINLRFVYIKIHPVFVHGILGFLKWKCGFQ
jgi:hypothetical protein